MGDPSRYGPHTRVYVYPFERQADGNEVIIGRPDLSILLALPGDAIEFLDHLAAGKTVGEATSLYHETYGEIPAVAELLEALEQKHFVRPFTDQDEGIEAVPPPAATTMKRYHFANFPQPLARALFGKVALCIYGVIIAAAGIAVLIDARVMLPSSMALVVQRHFTVTLIALILIGYCTVFIHEMAHLVAARAIGVSARLGIGNRLWYVVAEAEMTGIWMKPRRQRYLPILAGPLIDLTSAAVLSLVLFANGRGWIELSPLMHQSFAAMIIMYFFRLLWQFYFFMRTDLYYFIATLFNCKNLINDTKVFFLRWVRALFGRDLGRENPLASVPEREQRMIRFYAVIWIFGHVAAVAALVTLYIPLTYRYLANMYHVLRASDTTRYELFDALAMATLALFSLGLGFVLWIRNMIRHRAQTA